MNKNARKFSIVLGLILSLGLALLLIATFTVGTKDILGKNTNSGEVANIKMWEGFSYNNASVGNMILFNLGISFSLLGMAGFMFCNIWLTKRMSKTQSMSTFGKKRIFMLIAFPLMIIGLIVSFIAGGCWDEYKDPDGGGTGGIATTVHKFLAIAMFLAPLILILVQTSIIIKTKDIKNKIIIIPRKGV